MMIFSMKACFWLGYFLQFIISIYSNVPAKITDCVTQSTEPVYAEDETFHLCCTLYLECDRTSVNDSVILVPFPQNSTGFQQEGVHSRTGKCSARYTVKKAKVEDSLFHCFRNNPLHYRFAMIEVYVIEKPRDLRLEISVSEDNDINITLSYKCHDFYDEDVRITMKEPWSSEETELCLEVQCTKANHSMMCTCRYHNGPNPPMEKGNVSLTVQVKRSWDGTANISSEIEYYSVNWINFVRPDPVMQLTLFNVSSDDAIVTFRVSGKTRNLIRLMAERNQTFVYHVTLINSLHPEETLYFNITDMNEDQSNESIAAWINGMSPFTTYTISVYCSGGGGAGDAKQIEFITGKSVPLQPPQVEQFIFSRQENGTTTSSKTCIEIIIQPLEISSRGGDHFHYRLEIASGKGYRSSNACWRTCQVCGIPRVTLRARFWSVNEIGQSRNHTDLVIPWDTGSARPAMYAEMNGTQLLLTIRMPGQHQLEGMAVLWCQGPSLSRDGTTPVCYDVPKKLYVSPNSSAVNATLRVDLNLQDTYEECTTAGSFEQVTSSHVRYFYFDDETQTFGIAKTVQANRTKPCLALADRVQNLTLGNWTVKSFLSVQIGGQWKGMVEANCYFDIQSGFAKIHLNQFSNESGSFIRLYQHCGKTPQFMAQSLEMYNSSDDQCLSAHKINEVPSSLQATIYQLPQGMMFVCVVAVGENSTVKSGPYVLLVDNGSGAQDGVSDLVVAVVSSVATVCVVVVVLTIILCYIKRSQCNRTGIEEFIRVNIDVRDITDSSIPSGEMLEHQDGSAMETGVNDNANSNASDYLLLALSPPTDSNESSVSGLLKESIGEQVGRGRELGRELDHSEYGRTNLHFVPLSENCASCWASGGCNCTSGSYSIQSVIEDSSGCTSASSNVIDNSRNGSSGSSNVINDSRNCADGSNSGTNDNNSCASESSSDISSCSDSTVESSICTINPGNKQEPSCSPEMHAANTTTLVDDYNTNHYVSQPLQWTFQAPEDCGDCCSETSVEDDSMD